MRYPRGNAAGRDGGASAAVNVVGGGGAGEANEASGTGSESSNRVGRWPDRVAHTRLPEGESALDEMLGRAVWVESWAGSGAGEEDKVGARRERDVSYCAAGSERGQAR